MALMTLHQFIEEQKKKLAAFEHYYKEQVSINSVTNAELWPLAMQSGDWDEQLSLFDGTDSWGEEIESGFVNSDSWE